MSHSFAGIFQVWNWLYLEEEGQGNEGEEDEEDEVEGDRGVSVQFSPAEFLQVCFFIFSFLWAPPFPYKTIISHTKKEKLI